MLDLDFLITGDGGQVGPLIPVGQLLEVGLELVQLAVGQVDAQLRCACLQKCHFLGHSDPLYLRPGGDWARSHQIDTVRSRAVE